MKIVQITRTYKGGDKENVVNYRPVTVLLFFSEILERIKHNRLYLYLTENNLLYNKKFGFQKGRSTDHAIGQLLVYRLRVFIYLSKAFDTVNHKILLTKLLHCGIKNKSLDWFSCYLFNRKKFIAYNVNSKSTLLDISCRVPQGSILGPLLSLLYINHLPQA